MADAVSKQAFEALQQKVADLEKGHESLLNENEALRKQVGNRSTGEMKAKEKPKTPDKTFTVNKKNYKFVIPHFVYNKEVVTAVDALGDESILEYLVKSGSGAIVEVK